MANRPTINPCRRTQSPVMRDSNVATIRPHAVNKTKYGTNRPVTTHAAAKVLKGDAISPAEASVLGPLAQSLRYGNPLSDDEIDVVGKILIFINDRRR